MFFKNRQGDNKGFNVNIKRMKSTGLVKLE